MIGILKKPIRSLVRCARSAKSDRRGIGLLEAMVALLVLMVGIVSVMALMVSNTFMARVSRDQLIASNLAREGIELVRSVRDSNWLKIEAIELNAGGIPYKWDDGLYDPVNNNYRSYPVYNSNTKSWELHYSTNFGTFPEWKIYWKPATIAGNDAIYSQYDAGAQPNDAVLTKYIRVMYIDPICYDGTNENIITTGLCGAGQTKVGVRVRVYVGWQDNGTLRQTALEARIYNWK
jgi:hypothetical protein